MARHEIKIHANTGATSEKAPFTGSYITKSTLNLDMICAMAANLVGMPELKLKNLLQNSIEAFLDWEREEACRIHIDGGYVEIKLLGSFPAADSTWNPEKNKFVVVFVPDAKTRDHLINETPVIVTDETSTKVRVDNVFDADPTKAKPTEVIYGQNPFVSQGYNQVMSDAGAKAELVNARGVRFDCTVLEEMNRQNVKFKTAELLEAGDYRFMLTSRGGDAEGDLQTVMKKVKYLKVAPGPKTVTLTEATCHEGEGNRKYGRLTGTGLGPTVAGDRLSAHIVPAGDEPMDIDCTITDAAPDGTWLDYEFETGYVHAGDAVRFDYVGHGGVAGSPDQTADVGCVIE